MPTRFPRNTILCLLKFVSILGTAFFLQRILPDLLPSRIIFPFIAVKIPLSGSTYNFRRLLKKLYVLHVSNKSVIVGLPGTMWPIFSSLLVLLLFHSFKVWTYNWGGVATLLSIFPFLMYLFIRQNVSVYY